MKKNKLFKSVVMLAMFTSLINVSPAFANETTIGEVEVSEVTANYLNQLKTQLTSAKTDLEKLSKAFNNYSPSDLLEKEIDRILKGVKK